MRKKITFLLMNKILFTLCFLFLTCLSYAQSDCSSAVIVCGNTQTFNPSGIGNKLEQLACGGVENNSTWVAFQAKANGKLNFVIRPQNLSGQPVLLDFNWSLYALPGAPNVSNCDNKTQLSCNFAGSSTVFGIPGATGLAYPNYIASQFNTGVDVVTGNWYVIFVDQPSNATPSAFSIQFTGNPESPNLNSSPGIFDDKPDFSINTVSGCSGNYSFTNTSTATSGLASYLWDFGDGVTSTLASPSHSYITSGTYYVNLTVTDVNGCKTSIKKSLFYNANTGPVINNTGIFATTSCSDTNNGTITVTTAGSGTLGVSGGTPPYTYELVSPSAMIRTSQSSNVFTGLQPGGYIVKVTDACGKAAVSTTVTVPQLALNSLIGLGIQNIQAACSGSPTGTATIFANGSVPPYTMQLVASSPVTTTVLPALQRDPITATYYTTFTNLLPGSYTVEATDACGKKRRATFTVNTSTAPVATTLSSPSCAGVASGTLTVTATGANGLSGAGSPGAYQYALIAPSTMVKPFQNSSVFENLFPGNYTIAVKDACGNIGTSTSTVGSAVSPNFGTSFTTPSCPNGATGTIEVQNGTTVGGGGPYSYELIAPSPVTRPIQSSNVFNNLPTGTYTVRMSDVCGTQATTNVTVAAGTAPSFTVTTTTSCGSPENGSITVTPAASSIGPFVFELIGPGAVISTAQGSNVANSISSIFTGLKQGTYTIKMTDGCSVPVTATATITAPVALSFPVGSTAVASCASPGSGQITVAIPTTGVPPYTYELIAPSPVVVVPQSSRVFNGLTAGDYTIRITDSCGSQVTNSTPLTLINATAPSLTVTNTSSCVTNTGTITCIAATANQGGGSYQFALIAPSPVIRPNQVSPIFDNLSPGVYTVQITDQCGVTGTTTTTIAAAGAFVPAAGASVVSCSGSSYNAQIIVTTPQNFTLGGPVPTGSGGGPYTYAIYDSTNTTLIAGPQTSNVFSTIVPIVGTSTHTVRVTDVCGNTSTVSLTVNPPAAISPATISATTASCAASNTGVIKVTTGSGGGLAPYSYSLIDATTLAVVQGPQTSITFNNVPANATGYFVRTTDACGNSVTSSTALLFPAAVVPTATVAVVNSCATSSTGKITVTPGIGPTLAGGTFSYALFDSGNTTQIIAAQASPVFANIAVGNYTVRIIDRCGNIGTVTATVTSSVTTLTSSGTPSGTCSGGNSGVVTANSTGGALPITFTLINQVTSNVVAGPQSNTVFSNLANGTYIVRAIDACGTQVDSANIVLGDLTTAPTITTSSALDCGGSALIAGYGAGGSGGPFTYAICNGSGCTSFGTYTSSNTFTVTTSGTYKISVKDRCGNTVSSSDIVINLPVIPTISAVNFTNVCGPTTVTPVFSGIVNTPYYSIDGGAFSPVIGTLNPGAHTVSVLDYNAGIFSCPSSSFSFNINSVAPTGASPQSLSSISTVADIIVTGSGIVWYANATDAANAINPLPNSTVVLNNTTYYATQTIGGCPSTASLPVLIQTFLNVDNFDLSKFKFYPNPVESNLNMSYSENITNVTVFNGLGKQLHTEKSNNSSLNLDMSMFPSGLYLLKIESERGFVALKIIKK